MITNNQAKTGAVLSLYASVFTFSLTMSDNARIYSNQASTCGAISSQDVTNVDITLKDSASIVSELESVLA